MDEFKERLGIHGKKDYQDRKDQIGRWSIEQLAQEMPEIFGEMK